MNYNNYNKLMNSNNYSSEVRGINGEYYFRSGIGYGEYILMKSNLKSKTRTKNVKFETKDDVTTQTFSIIDKNNLNVLNGWSFFDEVQNSIRASHSNILSTIGCSFLKLENMTISFALNKVCIELKLSDEEGKLEKLSNVFRTLDELNEESLIHLCGIESIRDSLKVLGNLPEKLWNYRDNIKPIITVRLELPMVTFKDEKNNVCLYKQHLFTKSQLADGTYKKVLTEEILTKCLNVTTNKSKLEMITLGFATINESKIDSRISEIENELLIEVKSSLRSSITNVISDVFNSKEHKETYGNKLREWAILVKYRYTKKLSSDNIDMLKRYIEYVSPLSAFMED